MSFIRPEVAQHLYRWRESLMGLVVVTVGLVLFLNSFGLVWILGFTLIALGALLAIAGVQRARFRRGTQGPGMVRVDEAQLTYFGPQNGGVVALGDLRKVVLDPNGDNGAAWVVTGGTGDVLTIPLGAEGSDALFDAFALLPGLKTEAMLASLEAAPDHAVVVWQRSDIPTD